MEERDMALTADEGEETMVAPRFDDEETVMARPVVPFGEVGPDAPPSASAAVPPYARAQSRPRRSLVAALVLVSALVGSVLGVGGLYLYQKQRSDAAAAPATTRRQQQTDAPVAQPTPAPASESRADEKAAPAQPSNPAPSPDESEAKADGDAGSARDVGPEEAKAAPVAERRDAREGSAAATKRGKKGERDEEMQRGERRARRDNDDGDRQLRAEDTGDGPVARRVGVITYRPRRARPRRDAYGDPDRLRRIFEGQP
jgi:hypothetical protein